MKYNYDRPTPETDAFMSRIDDSSVDLGQVRSALADMECERDSLLELLPPQMPSEIAQHLCEELERWPASEQQTRLSLLASQLRKELETYEQTRMEAARGGG